MISAEQAQALLYDQRPTEANPFLFSTLFSFPRIRVPISTALQIPKLQCIHECSIVMVNDVIHQKESSSNPLHLYIHVCAYISVYSHTNKYAYTYYIHMSIYINILMIIDLYMCINDTYPRPIPRHYHIEIGMAIPDRLVMALEIASAEHTPFPPPDMSSPRRSLENLSFIISISETHRVL